ncbi:alpha/beta hydrolase [Alginatibacterium sediminis]|uniref:Alpha/beta hydrolase n=1 Tax=Alginatibacterium sediminis TaxID=2164068 RepID=A0A420E8B4_9ALTE|nr:alpha/beta hydrolase [Alginatibacterium sediminis]RKF15749.1 alpha/beta hydrolase [Alginatibacterium sediminis]
MQVVKILRQWQYYGLALVGLITACSPVPKGLEQQQLFVEQQLENNPALAKHQLDLGKLSIYSRSQGTPTLATVVWVHGTPGSWSDGAYIIGSPSLTDDMLVYALDRPGWGLSQAKQQGLDVSDFESQAHFLLPWFKQIKSMNPDKPLVIVGHSWGASLIPSLVSQSEDIDAALLLAGALDPSLAKPRWYNKFAGSVAGAWVLSQFDIGELLLDSNKEMYNLAPGLQNSAQELAAMGIPTIVIQGLDDGLVDPLNARYAKQHLPKSNSRVIELEQQGHLLQIESPALIEQCIRALLSQRFQDCY